MLKKFLLAAMMMFALVPMQAQEPASNPDQATEAVVATAPDGQEYVAADVPEAAPTDLVEESEITRKMTQAEKAKNAAENDSWGGAITLIAMGIVIGALIVLSILFFCFGKISSRLMVKKKRETYGLAKDDDHDHIADLESGETVAAIGAALAEYFADDSHHDMEDTILTIRRMRKAYSPWNSKIYNMREVPQLQRNNGRKW